MFITARLSRNKSENSFYFLILATKELNICSLIIKKLLKFVFLWFLFESEGSLC
jgi:hypothetical protein